MTDATPPLRFIDRFVKREPLKLWAILLGAVAVTVQSLAYSTTRWFYAVFGVTPEEVGFGYADFLGRKGLEIALLSVVGVLLLAALSLAVAGVYAVYSSERLANRWERFRAQNDPRSHADVQRSRLIGLLSFFAYGITFGATGLDVRILASGFIVVFFVVDLTLASSWRRSTLYRLMFMPRKYSTTRLVVLVGLGIVVAEAGEGGLAASASGVLMVLIFNSLVPAPDVPLPINPTPIRRGLSRIATRWFVGVACVVLLSVTLVALIGGFSRILESSLSPMVQAVYEDGEGVDIGIVNLDPLLLGAPRAEVVRVGWVAANPPVEFTAQPARLRLIYFGQANGVSVFFDPSTQVTLRLPSAAIVVSASRGEETWRP